MSGIYSGPDGQNLYGDGRVVDAIRPVQVTFEFIVTEKEAFQLIAPWRSGEDFRMVYFSRRTDDPFFTSNFKKLIGQTVRFIWRDDIIVVARVCDAIVNMDDFTYRLDFWPEEYKPARPDHTGVKTDRLTHPFSIRERAFADEWLRDNEEPYGTLHDLTHKDFGLLNDRERKLVATIIQWLGTNCGSAFLHRVEQRSKEATKAQLLGMEHVTVTSVSEKAP